MSHRLIVSVGTLALGAGGALAVAPAAVSSDQYTGPNGAITTRCDSAGQRISFGRLYDKTGKAHPTARWNLYASAKNGGTKCLTVHDPRGGSHRMAAMIRPVENYHDGAKAAGVFTERAPAVSLKKAGNGCIGITAELTDKGRFYQRNIESYCPG